MGSGRASGRQVSLPGLVGRGGINDKDFKLVCWAVDAEERGDRPTALRWWRAVFRDGFPYQPARLESASPWSGFWDIFK